VRILPSHLLEQDQVEHVHVAGAAQQATVYHQDEQHPHACHHLVLDLDDPEHHVDALAGSHG
ncbi:hypothetical protein, partial [Morganella morganii]|uniref:hypothetical protein n=1 Tax=Morganella morganii TaxID=582 RepID=UPI001953ECD1